MKMKCTNFNSCQLQWHECNISFIKFKNAGQQHLIQGINIYIVLLRRMPVLQLIQSLAKHLLNEFPKQNF